MKLENGKGGRGGGFERRGGDDKPDSGSLAGKLRYRALVVVVN